MKKRAVRKSISFSPTLAGEISERARENHRSFSAQVVHDMRAVIEHKKMAKSRVMVTDTYPPIHDLVIEDNPSQAWASEKDKKNEQ